MHILLITSAYKSKFNPVNALFFRDQALALKNSGNQVGVICALPVSFKTIIKEHLFNFSKESYVDSGVDTIVSPFISIPRTPKRTISKMFKIGKKIFLEYIEKYGLPDIIHLHTFLAGELALWVKKKYNIPYVVTEHSTNFARKNYSKRQLEFAKRVFSESKKNIAVSKEFCSLLEKQFSVNFKYIPNVVDTSFFRLEKKDFKKEKYTFLNVAHLDSKKNHKGLINAFQNKFFGNNQYELIIAGDGPEMKNLNEQISSLDLHDQVKLFGRVSREKVLELMIQSDCFVLSSFHETFGVVLIEAMSCGLPVISTRSGGPESIITSDDYGFLCGQSELGETMNKVTKIEFNPTIIREFAKDNFSQIAVSKKLEEIYFE